MLVMELQMLVMEHLMLDTVLQMLDTVLQMPAMEHQQGTLVMNKNKEDLNMEHQPLHHQEDLDTPHPSQDTPEADAR